MAHEAREVIARGIQAHYGDDAADDWPLVDAILSALTAAGLVVVPMEKKPETCRLPTFKGAALCQSASDGQPASCAKVGHCLANPPPSPTPLAQEG